MTEQTQKLIDDVANELRPIVVVIEASPQSTQFHYGRYLEILIATAKGDSTRGKAVALALMKAGANKLGVLSAYRILFNDV